jgi:hypothetical protein
MYVYIYYILIGYIGSPEIGDRAKYAKILSIFSMFNVDVDIMNMNEGVTALHLAAAYGNVKLIDWLIVRVMIDYMYILKSLL